MRYQLHLLLAVLSAPLCFAQPVPKLNSLSENWFQRGTESEVMIRGENLAGARKIIVSGAPGVTATINHAATSGVAIESASGDIRTVAAPDGKEISITLQISADAPLVERELRVVTAAGVSNPLEWNTSELPQVKSAAENNSLESAQSIPLPSAISGVISSAAQSRFFKFRAGEGEKIVFNLYAQRLGGSALDSSLAILDLNGRELARNEDAAGLDSILQFTAAGGGEYVLQLRDFRFQGGGDYKYRLIAGALPHVSGIFPYGGQRGELVEIQLTGVNLEGASKLRLHLAGDAAPGRQELRASTPRGLSNPFSFEISEQAQVMEVEPNSSPDKATPSPIPAAINGRMDPENDVDYFRFTAQKNQRIVFDVEAFSFGSPLDALLTLKNSQGAILQRNDDASGADARLDYRFPEGGKYQLCIEDLLGRGGENFAYRIRASVPRPDFSVVFLPDTPRVRRGGRVPVRVEVNRVNGFNEAVKVSARDLPTGLHAEPVVILPSGPASGLLMISATPDAPMGSFPLHLIATAGFQEPAAERAAQPLSGDKPAMEAFVTILEGAPFSISPATLMASIEQNQSGTIDVLVERRDGFSGEIKITPEGFSAGREPITKSFDFQPLVIKSGETRGTLTMTAKLDSEIGTRSVLLKGEAGDGGATFVDYSGLIPLATAEIPFVLTTTLKRLMVTALPADSESAASEAVFNVKAQRRAGFKGPIQLKLEGIPENVSATVPELAEGVAEVTIKLVASQKAAAGKDHKLTLTGEAVHGDRTYRFQPDHVMLTINTPQPSGKPEPKIAVSN